MEKINILLTGASRGIGLAACQLLLSENNLDADIIIVSRESPEEFKDHKNVFYYKCDLSSHPETEQVIGEILHSHEHVDVLINNAGAGTFGNAEDISLPDWERLLSLNLTAPFLFIKHFLPGMKKKGRGRIINITSDADHIAYAGASLYCATKYGLRGFSEALRKELIGLNISVTTIAPGRVDTYFNKKKPGDRPISLRPSDVAKQILHVILQDEKCEIETIYLKSNLE